MQTQKYNDEIEAGERFPFGQNWANFLRVLDDERIGIAERSLKDMLGVESLEGKTFLDIGSGSGLFSLCARRLGARVRSFDYDPQSVACTRELKNRYYPDDEGWVIEEGSVLDKDYIEQLGSYDVVYSWGVLHHTGAMWTALEHASLPVKPGGKLFVAIYNDQGRRSLVWRKVKQIYCSGPLGRLAMKMIYIPYFALYGLKEDLLHFKKPWARYSEYRANRGMSLYYDWIDWLGGYPFEFARPDEIFEFFHQRGFDLTKLVTVGNSLACHQHVFVRRASKPEDVRPYDMG